MCASCCLKVIAFVAILCCALVNLAYAEPDPNHPAQGESQGIPEGFVEVSIDTAPQQQQPQSLPISAQNAQNTLSSSTSKECPSSADQMFAQIAAISELTYRRPKLTYATFISWPSMDLLEKLPFLLDRVDCSQLLQDFRYMLKVHLFNNNHNSIQNFPESVDDFFCASKEIVTSFLSEFQSPEVIEQFWVQCNKNADSYISFTEYAVCRDHFDVYANYGGNGEYARRESVLIQDFEAKLRSSKLQPDIYTYDENGIIVD